MDVHPHKNATFFLVLIHRYPCHMPFQSLLLAESRLTLAPPFRVVFWEHVSGEQALDAAEKSSHIWLW
jgi:hypothetical protein